MNRQEYLWDRSGPPDPIIVELERKLAPLGYQRGRNRWGWIPVAALAAAAAIVIAVLFTPGAMSEWQDGGKRLRVGQTIETNERATLAAESIGTLTVESGARLRLTGQREFSLERGTIHALIWAAPGNFVIDTPAAKAVDLGCQYTLQVDDRGNGLLRVETGWVAFQATGRESFIPAGASCRTYAGRGLGTPYVVSAGEEFRKQVDAFDGGEAAALPRVLSASGPGDALTLWHLLPRTRGPERAAVYDRLAGFVRLPSREAVLRGDEAAIAASWDALGYGDTSWWRSWKQVWPR